MRDHTEMATMSGMGDGEQRMTSLDIAEVTGKQHKDVLKAIRNMEPAWESECGRKFAPTSVKVKMPQGGVRMIPAYSQTKTELLYAATKFNRTSSHIVVFFLELFCRIILPVHFFLLSLHMKSMSREQVGRLQGRSS